jgi:DNA-binding transcriptional regulator YiaG
MNSIEIKELRKKINLTQEQFARKVGVTLLTVSKWEGEKSKPSPMAIDRLNNLKKELYV